MSTYPVRILRVITWLPWGGIEKRMVEVLKRIDRKRFIPMVLCLRSKKGVYEEELEKAGIPVMKLNFRSRLDPEGIYSLIKVLKKEKVDIIHSHMYRANIPALIAGKIAGVKGKIIQIHNIEDWKGKREWWMERLFFRWADRIVAVSRAVMEYEKKFVNIPPEKEVILYNGIEIHDFHLKPDLELKRSLGIPFSAKVIGIVARLHPDKGQDILLEVGREIIREVREVYFLLVGEGGYRRELEKIASREGIKSRVIFTGGVKDPRPYYSIMDISVLPSVREGFCNVILESLASGIPVVASNVGGNPEVIEEGKEGFLIPYGDREMLKARILTLLKDEELRQKMRERARRKAEEFSLERMVRETERLYSSLVEK